MFFWFFCLGDLVHFEWKRAKQPQRPLLLRVNSKLPYSWGLMKHIYSNGISCLWLSSGGGTEAGNRGVLKITNQHRATLLFNHCPLMFGGRFFPNVHFPLVSVTQCCRWGDFQPVRRRQRRCLHRERRGPIGSPDPRGRGLSAQEQRRASGPEGAYIMRSSQVGMRQCVGMGRGCLCVGVGVRCPDP